MISAPTASYEITLKIYGEMKKMHRAHSGELPLTFSRSWTELGASFSQAMCWVYQADRKNHSKYPF